ncbi:MAG: four helix bundle protein [Pyrinomonadaceae bacterium]
MDRSHGDLKDRTRAFAVRIIKLFSALPKTTEAQVVGKQILRSGTSAGAQYREAQHAKSDADFISKIEGSLQELEETTYWLELLVEMNLFSAGKMQAIRQETQELTAIFVTIVKRVKARKR